MVFQSLLTPEETAVFLGVRQAELVSLPGLPVVMIGKDARYAVRDINRWIESRRLVPIARLDSGRKRTG